MPDMGEWRYILSDNITTSGAWVRCVLGFLVCSVLLTGCEGQGRLVDPPSRASMWRYDFSNPVDFNDDRVDCGGFVRQWRKNQGRCGVCGDPWDLPKPRPHETRGRYARGIIVHNYTQAQAVVVEVEMTAANSGHFEYQLCPRASTWTQETQECFTHALKDDLGRTQIPVNVTQKLARLRHVLRLPQDLVCLACILQWKFVTEGRAGRAEYRACADVTITPVTSDVTTTPVTTKAVTTAFTTPVTTTAVTTAVTTPVTTTAVTTPVTIPVTDNTTITTTTDGITTTITTTTEETTTTTTTTLESLGGKFNSSSSQTPEINFSFPHATHTPTLKSQRPQIDAPPTHTPTPTPTPTHTRMNDVMQNDRSNADKSGANSRFSASLDYGVTLMVLIYKCRNFI